MQLEPRIHHLPVNERGRDLIVGDLHGCRAALDRLLDEAGFDPAADRLISVGDLTDRGPDHAGCLALLEEPWFHAVRGNHDEMILRAASTFQPERLLALCNEPPQPGDEPRRDLRGNGGNWLLDLIDRREDLPWLFARIEQLGQLPHILVVGGGAWRYNVVHADLTTLRTPTGFWRDHELDEGWFHGRGEEVVEHATWSRAVHHEYTLPTAWAPGLSRTYCGHTIQEQPVQRSSHCCIDTGAFVGYRDRHQKLLSRPALTLVEHRPDAVPTWSAVVRERTVTGCVQGLIDAEGRYRS